MTTTPAAVAALVDELAAFRVAIERRVSELLQEKSPPPPPTKGNQQ
jgi:hypothetical protein